jgi:ubiquilin
VFTGRILKDEQTVASYEITDGLTVHLVRGKTAQAAG